MQPLTGGLPLSYSLLEGGLQMTDDEIRNRVQG